MPRNSSSEDRKKYVVSLLENRLGALHKEHKHRSDWHSSANSSIDVFITDSKPHSGRRTWFDMAESDIKALASHPAGFIIFILGYRTNFLVVPAKDLTAQLPYYQPGHTTELGRYYFNLNVRGNAFEQLPNWNLHPYKDKIDLIPKK